MSETAVLACLDAIDRAWLERRPREMAPYLHAEIVMVFPGFAGRTRGREEFIAGFAEFIEAARVIDYSRATPEIDVVGSTAIASFAFAMTYEREGDSWRSTGRDVWVFSQIDGSWIATWRTMLDIAERHANEALH